MATLTGFSRPSDPINAVDMAAQISAAIGKTVTCDITETDILVTGATISSADTSGIQLAMNAYFYSFFQYGAPLVDNPDMSVNRHNKGISEHAAYTADSAVYALAQRKAWVSGVLKPDSFVYYSKASTASGIVTFYLTNDGTSSGTAVFNNIYADTITVTPYGSSAVYQVSSPVISGDKKSISITVNQVTSVVLGLIQITSAANSIPCNLLVLGD